MRGLFPRGHAVTASLVGVLVSVRLWVICLAGVGFLTGCGGGGEGTSSVPPANSVATSTTSTSTSTVTRFQGHVLLDAPVAKARVYVVLADGNVWGSGTTSLSGSYDINRERIPTSLAGILPVVHEGPSFHSGLQANEFRVLAILQDGTQLFADGSDTRPFLHVTVPSSLKTLLRMYRSDVTLAQAETDIKAYLRIPMAVSLENVGGPHSAFSATEFIRRATVAGGVNGFLAYLNGQVQLSRSLKGVPSLQRAVTNTFATVESTAAATGIDSNNQDSEGSSDPDFTTAFSGVQGDLGTTDATQGGVIATDKFGYAGNLIDHSAQFISNLNQNVQQLADLYSDEIEAAFKAGKALEHGEFKAHVVTKAKYLAYASFIVSALSFAATIAMDWYSNDSTSEVQQAVNVLSAKIDELEKKLTEAKIEIIYTIKKQTASTASTNVKAKMDTVSSLKLTSSGFQAYSETKQQQIMTLAQSNTGSANTKTLAEAVSGTESLVQSFNQQYMLLYGISTGSSSTRYHSYPFRSNAITLDMRNFFMSYFHQMELAMGLDGEESHSSYCLKTSPAASVNALANRMEGNSETFGANGISALRRQALLAAPPRFPSDKVCVDTVKKLAWSQEVLVKKRSEFVTSLGWGNSRADGTVLWHNDYELSADFLPKGCGWRIPTKAELQALPGWGSTTSYLTSLGLPSGLPSYFAYYDATAENPYELSTWSSITLVYGQVRFVNFTTGNDVSIKDMASDDNIASLRVVTLPGIAATAETYAWPDLASRKPSWWPTKAYRSNVMLSAGVVPDAIVVVDNRVSNPVYNEKKPWLNPKELRVVSALAYWKMDPADGVSRGVVADVSGRVVWKSSDTSIAKVENTCTYDPDTRRAAAPKGQFVSTWYAPVIFSQADKEVTISANWSSSLGDSTLADSSKITIKQAADAALGVPPVYTGLSVTPGNIAWTRFADADGTAFSASASKSDKTVEDLTNGVEWSLYTVQTDGTGKETGTTPFPDTHGSISQASGITLGGVLHLTDQAKTLGPTQLRIQAKHAATGFVEKTDVLLQFNNT